MNTTPAEVEAVCEISTALAADPCRFEHAWVLRDQNEGINPTRPTLRNLYRFVGVCARCDEPADPETTRRLREELGEDLAQGAMT